MAAAYSLGKLAPEDLEEVSVKCTTKECTGEALERAAIGNERLEMSTGRVATTIHACVCGWARFTVTQHVDLGNQAGIADPGRGDQG